jgi:hypothetical protein
MTTIRYGDIAVGAKEAFKISTVENELSGISQKEQILQNLAIGNYENPIEQYAVVLDGSSLPLKRNMQNTNSGFWSDIVSNQDGSFEVPITIELEATESFKTKGITLEFDKYTNFYPKFMRISVYLNDDMKGDFDFLPNNYMYFCDFRKEFEYNKLVITIFSLNAPYNRLKIRSLVFGEGVIFLSNEIKNISISHVLDVSSLTLPINTATIRLHTSKANELNFEEQQPLIIDSNNGIESKVYITSAKRINNTDFNITAEGEISLLEGVDFVGGIYSNKNAYELYTEIFTASNTLYSIDESFKDITVSGYLPYSTCRASLQQLAFATNAVVVSSYIEGIKVVPYDDIVGAKSKAIGLGRLKSQNIDTQKAVGSITVTAHEYSKETTEQKVVFEDKGTIAEDEEVEIFIKFDTPHYDFVVTDGTEIESGDNFIKIKAKQNCKVTAKEYTHKTSQKTMILNEKSKNAKSISKATLVSEQNIDKVLEKCYNYYSKNKVGKMDIIDIEQIKVGDMLNVKTLYSKDIQGIVVSQNYSIIGNTFVKDTEVLGG